eukprot:scaffold392462_cov21-Prasinocladus_malaysianus.AAC.1
MASKAATRATSGAANALARSVEESSSVKGTFCPLEIKVWIYYYHPFHFADQPTAWQQLLYLSLPVTLPKA